METVKNDEKGLMESAEDVVQSKFLKFLTGWVESASKAEKKGLKILGAIYKTMGKKKFRSREVKNETWLKLSAEQLRKKQMRSSYDIEFCPDTPDSHEPEIFKYRSVNDFQFSQVLKDNAKAFLNNWLSLGDDAEYKSLVWLFLKSFYSVYKVRSGFLTSTHRESFQWVDSEKSENRIKSVSKPNEPEGHKRTLSLQIQPEKILPKVDRGYKLKAQQGLMGNGKITTWVSNLKGKDFSLYQDSYIPLHNKRILSRRADFHTSIVCKLLPSK